jgi:two-component system, sensor histidine kinase and response regulator
MALRHQGYRVLLAESGSAGLEIARQQWPDLILTDVNMPSGNGQVLLQQIRNDPELVNKQVVLMTGRPDLVTPRGAMEAGADDFLMKPVGRDALLRCMEARLNRAEIHWRVEDRMLNTLRSSLHTNLPHEFFTPLAGIIGLSEILLAEPPNFTPEEVHGFHHDIHESALRLHRTLRNYLLILEFQDSSDPSPGEVPVPSLTEWEAGIRSGVSMAARQNKRSEDIVLVIEGAPLAVRASDLTLMVEELVENACKFSRRETPIEIHFDSHGTLTVTDHGRGLAAEEIRQIGVFRQFDRKKYEHQGLGLGLVLVQKLASRYSAGFSIKSEPGKGTSIEIAFPASAPSPENHLNDRAAI